uniref:Superoxide dismutase [Cu-Zn] n=1 Tax=Dictyocaulus viviparus TaxID=29172 RepID=A7L9U0_DICVI|nr:extracellular superoxide dismutase [Dictyocaulus viviparus]
MILHISLIISTILLGVHAHGNLCRNGAFMNVVKARAYMFEAVPDGDPQKLIGIIDFVQYRSLVKLNGTVSGLKPGLHGFHVHEKGNLANGCLAAGGHYNPYKLMHGAPSDSNRHVGDLGNIVTSANGETVISISDPVITLNGYHSVIGRAVVIHADADDLGLGRSEMSKSTGNSGARVACGVIGIV